MYTKKTHIHFVGIGGIGMSGIAKILAHQGYTISGCDIDCAQKTIHELQELGCRITPGNNTSSCDDRSIEVLVYSSAIQQNDPEIVRAQERGIPTITRALMLAELMRTKFSIAISGAHGKTTTTSLISHCLIEAHCDPTVIIGGHLKNISNNARYGDGNFLVAEADESDRSLVRLYPTFAVVTNIDFEHVDTYKDIDDIKQTFKTFLEHIPFYGKAFICYDDPHIRSLVPELTHIKSVKYGLSSESDFYATDIMLEKDHTVCSVWNKDTSLGTLVIPMPGIHNLYNSLATVAVLYELDIPFAECARALANFKGIDRRFSYKGTYQGAQVFDDYGHHPTEIKHALAVARKRAEKRLVVAFQLHRYSRTKGLWNDFIEVLAHAKIDHLIITDIYPASEQPIAGVTSENFVADLKKHAPLCSIEYVPYDAHFNAISIACAHSVKADDLLLTLGAGKMNKLAEHLVQAP